ncbi:MAG TPA: hypothetical protein DCY07_04695 [Rhodospirillaceae bacterium]|nr:hypothetical protein [Rhodospirillaceae bacterium]
MTAKPRNATLRTYVDPFLDMKRNLVYLGTFLGVFGFGLVNIFSSYDLGAGGYAHLAAYFAPAILLAGFVYYPLLYMGFSTADGLKWRFFLFALQLAAIAAYLIAPPIPFWRGLAAGIVLAPFWTSHHIAMVQNTTTANRGFEVALSMFVNLLSGVATALIAAHYLKEASPIIAVSIALIAMMAGTGCLLLASRCVRQNMAHAFVKECKDVMHDNPYMARRIISQSLFEAASFTIAALMFQVGISPTIMATILIARLAVMAFLSPLVGKIAHNHRQHGYALALFFIGLSWVVLALMPSNPFVFFAFMILYAIGMAFADSALVSGLYEMQSYASMLWSEFYLSVGRSAGFLLFVPLMFVNVTLYLLALAALAGALYVFNRRWQKRWAEAGAM